MQQQQLRVAMIINGYTPRVGGAERMLAAIAPRLQQLGIHVHVLTRRYPGFTPFAEIDGIPVTRLPIPGPKALASLTFTITALPLLHHLRPHVIHAHDLFSTTTTALISKMLRGTPVVVTPHGGGERGELFRLKQKLLGGIRLRLFCQQVDAFTVISHELGQQFAAVGIPSERCYRIPNGVDAERFTPVSPGEKQALRARLKLPDGFLVIYAGRLSPEKRPGNLVAVWETVHAHDPTASLLILGRGPEEETLRAHAHPSIQFLGTIDDVAPYLQAADLFVLPSAAEGLSVALLEAQATGLAAVATAVGGNPDIITHGENGLLVPPDDLSALTQALLSFLSDPQQRETCGKRGRERVLQDYTLSIMAERLLQLYRNLVR